MVFKPDCNEELKKAVDVYTENKALGCNKSRSENNIYVEI